MGGLNGVVLCRSHTIIVFTATYTLDRVANPDGMSSASGYSGEIDRHATTSFNTLPAGWVSRDDEIGGSAKWATSLASPAMLFSR